MKISNLIPILFWTFIVIPESTVTGQVAVGNWTWLGGTRGLVGSYGTQGVGAPENFPCSRTGHSMVMHPSGKYILVFAGYGYDSTNDPAVKVELYFNDLWMFNITSGWWTWVSGSDTGDERGNYGIQGVSSLNNRPGARMFHTMNIHPSGQLIYVFGGFGYDTASKGSLNDMWMFNLTERKWTWLKGAKIVNQAGIYGTQGVVTINNEPGARFAHAAAMDPSGQLIFLFGGNMHNPPNYSDRFNDMWTFNLSSKCWTWVNGGSTKNQTGIYGNVGKTSMISQPGARGGHSMVMHPSGRSAFLFGGDGYGSDTTPGYLNDVWQFDITSGSWTWLSGSNATNKLGVYGVVSAPYGGPGARFRHSMQFDTLGQIIYMFGGKGYASPISAGNLNDLWAFDIRSGLWTWLSGSDKIEQQGNLGTKGSPSPNNRPGSRFQHTMTMHPSGQFLFVLGGTGYASTSYGYLNDMWSFTCTMQGANMSTSELFSSKRTPTLSQISAVRSVSTTISIPFSATSKFPVSSSPIYAISVTSSSLMSQNDISSSSKSSSIYIVSSQTKTTYETTFCSKECTNNDDDVSRWGTTSATTATETKSPLSDKPPGNFWIEQMWVALIILACAFVILFEIGFWVGFTHKRLLKPGRHEPLSTISTASPTYSSSVVDSSSSHLTLAVPSTRSFPSPGSPFSHHSKTSNYTSSFRDPSTLVPPSTNSTSQFREPKTSKYSTTLRDPSTLVPPSTNPPSHYG